MEQGWIQRGAQGKHGVMYLASYEHHWTCGTDNNTQVQYFLGVMQLETDAIAFILYRLSLFLYWQ